MSVAGKGKKLADAYSMGGGGGGGGGVGFFTIKP